MTNELSQMPLRIPAEDHAWLKAFVAQYPKDSLNAMMARFIRSRIKEMVEEDVPGVITPPYDPQPSPIADF